MTKICFICETPFQVLNCLNYMYFQREYLDVSGDIFVGNTFKNSHKIVENLRKEKIFHDVFYYDYSKYDETFVGNIQRAIRPAGYVKKLSGCQNDFKKYDCVFVSTVTQFPISTIMACKNAKTCFYDDGLGSYLGYIGEHGLTWKRKLLYILSGNDYRRLKPEVLYVNSKELCRSRLTSNVIQLHPTSAEDEGYIELLNRVFDYKKDRIYSNKKLVYITRPNDSQKKEIDEKDKLIEHELSDFEEQCILRVHPRQKDYSIGKIMTDTIGNLWEMVCLEEITDEHILLGEFSTAQTIPKMLFNKEPWIIFTYDMYKESKSPDVLKDWDEFTTRIRGTYHNPEKVIKITDVEELALVLKKILNR